MTRLLLGAAIAGASLLAALPAQLNGGYTINNALPTGGTNFASFVDAAAALGSQGIAGPVRFLVFNGTGPYGGFAIATAVTGASSANRIEFVAAPGQAPVVNGPAGSNLQTIKFGTVATANSGPSWIRVSGLTVQGAPTGAAILCAGCTNMVVERCRALNCGAGVYFTQTQNSVIQDCEVDGCAMTPGTPGANGTYVGGITLYERSDACLVQRNRVHDCTGNGIFLGGGGSNTAQVRDDVVINNFVWNCPGLSTYPGGIALRRITGSTVSNNSVLMPAGSTHPGLHIQAATLAVTPPVGAAAEVSNNVVRHLGSGPCVAFDVTNAVVPLVFDHNHYDAASTGPVGRVATVAYATLAAWQAVTAPPLAGKEVNTIAAPADFVSATDLRILPTSGAWNSGAAVALVAGDIEQTVRPSAGSPDRGAHELRASAYATLYGETCNGAAGPVVMRTAGTYQHNSTLTISSSNHAANAPGLLVFGVSKTSYGPLALPFRLDALFGTHYCYLNAGLDLTVAGISGATAPATLSFTLTVPPLALGAVIHAQHVCLEPVPGGLSASNGVTVQFP